MSATSRSPLGLLGSEKQDARRCVDPASPPPPCPVLRNDSLTLYWSADLRRWTASTCASCGSSCGRIGRTCPAHWWSTNTRQSTAARYSRFLAVPVRSSPRRRVFRSVSVRLAPAMSATSSPARQHYAVKVAPRSFSNTAPKCTRCEKSVYAAEQAIGPGGKVSSSTSLLTWAHGLTRARSNTTRCA
jgi:hypothetical protein